MGSLRRRGWRRRQSVWRGKPDGGGAAGDEQSKGQSGNRKGAEESQGDESCPRIYGQSDEHGKIHVRSRSRTNIERVTRCDDGITPNIIKSKLKVKMPAFVSYFDLRGLVVKAILCKQKNRLLS